MPRIEDTVAQIASRVNDLEVKGRVPAAQVPSGFSTGLVRINNGINVGSFSSYDVLGIKNIHGWNGIHIFQDRNSSTEDAHGFFLAGEPGITYNAVIMSYNWATAGSVLARVNTSQGGAYIRLIPSGMNFNIISTGGANTQAMNIDASGNIGIGVSAASNLRLWSKGIDNTSSNYAFYCDNLAGTGILYARNDGAVLMGTGPLLIGGSQILTTRRTGWAAWTGTPTRTSKATSTATLANVAEALKALIDDLITHGIIGT